MACLYYSTMLELMDNSAPYITKKFTIKPSSPWLNDELRLLKHDKRREERQFIKNPTTSNKIYFNEIKKKYIIECNHGQSSYRKQKYLNTMVIKENYILSWIHGHTEIEL